MRYSSARSAIRASPTTATRATSCSACRFELDLYVNVRPVKLLDDRLMPLKGAAARTSTSSVFRENTEGVYVGIGGQFKKGTPDEIAINEDVNTRKGVERIIRPAFEFAKAHGKTRCAWPTRATR